MFFRKITGVTECFRCVSPSKVTRDLKVFIIFLENLVRSEDFAGLPDTKTIYLVYRSCLRQQTLDRLRQILIYV